MIATMDTTIAFDIKSHYTECLKPFQQNKDCKLIVNHFGVFSKDFGHALATEVEEVLASHGENKLTIKRVYSILLEGIETIRLNKVSHAHAQQDGFLLAVKCKSEFTLIFGSVLCNSQLNEAKAFLEGINFLSDSELNHQFREMLLACALSGCNSKELGWLLLRRKSDSPLRFETVPLGVSKSILILEVAIKIGC
jgi:hypothetical protein